MATNRTRKLLAQALHALEEEKRTSQMPDARHLAVCVTELENVIFRYNTLAVLETPPQPEHPPMEALRE